LGFASLYESDRLSRRTFHFEWTKTEQLRNLENEKNILMERLEHQILMTKQLREIIEDYAKQVGCTLPKGPEADEDA